MLDFVALGLFFHFGFSSKPLKLYLGFLIIVEKQKT